MSLRIQLPADTGGAALTVSDVVIYMVKGSASTTSATIIKTVTESGVVDIGGLTAGTSYRFAAYVAQQ